MDGFNIAIARSTLPQVAAERLRALIIEGILAPGARLNERELSVQLVALSRDDVGHAFEVMASLEGLAGELAAARVTDADLDDLKALQGDLEKPHRRRDLPGYYRVNRAIHDRLNLIAANPVLDQTCRTLNARLHALRFRSNLNGAKWDRAVAEHRSMLSALAARDGAGLRDLLVRHLNAKLEVVLETMTGQDKE